MEHIMGGQVGFRHYAQIFHYYANDPYIHYFVYPRIFRVAYAANISEHLAIRREIDHHTGNYVPYSFRTVCGFFYVPQN